MFLGINLASDQLVKHRILVETYVNVKSASDRIKSAATTKAAQPTHQSAAPHATTKAAGTAKPVKTTKKAGGKDDSSSESGEKKSSKHPKPAGTTKGAQPSHESAAPHATTKAAQPSHESAAPHATTKAAGTAKPVKTSEFPPIPPLAADYSFFQPKKPEAK
ncbi:unnamed protein product, partial [Adineta ricciae]